MFRAHRAPAAAVADVGNFSDLFVAQMALVRDQRPAPVAFLFLFFHWQAKVPVVRWFHAGGTNVFVRFGHDSLLINPNVPRSLQTVAGRIIYKIRA
jgi:hypothetical protein